MFYSLFCATKIWLGATQICLLRSKLREYEIQERKIAKNKHIKKIKIILSILTKKIV
jgi:hypothetical protein